MSTKRQTPPVIQAAQLAACMTLAGGLSLLLRTTAGTLTATHLIEVTVLAGGYWLAVPSVKLKKDASMPDYLKFVALLHTAVLVGLLAARLAISDMPDTLDGMTSWTLGCIIADLLIGWMAMPRK